MMYTMHVELQASASRQQQMRTERSCLSQLPARGLTTCACFGTRNKRITNQVVLQQFQPQRLLVRAAAAAAGGLTDSAQGSAAAGLSTVKTELLRTLCSADRGLAVDEELAAKVQQMCSQLEVAGGGVQLNWGAASGSSSSSGSAEGKLSLLNGRWRLVYSSGFVDGSLGGSRPGPPSIVTPFVLGQVYQDVAVYIGKLDNVVDLQFKTGIGLPGAPPAVTATLRHTFEVEGSNTVKIVFEDTEVKTKGGFNNLLNSIPTIGIPQLPQALRPPQDLRSARFDVTFLDDNMRITRGDRGELRVYLRP